MSKHTLSENLLKTVTCPSSCSSIDIHDGNGLILRLSHSGVRIWRYRYKIDGVKKTITLGSYPDLSLKEARKQRDRIALLRKAGVDPSIQQPTTPTTPKRNPELAPEPEQSSKVSFKEVVDEYLKTLAHKPSHKEVKRALYKDLVPLWGKRDPEGITLRECVLFLDKIAKRAPVLSDRLYAYLKRAYAVSIQRGLITTNPLVNVQKPAPESEIRDNSGKVLTHEQLKTLVQSINELQATMMDDVLMMILWTGARPSEVLKMEWSQIDGEQWTLGAKQHKGGHLRPRSVTRPLNGAALELLKTYKGKHEQYVFPGKFEKPSSHIRLSRHVRDIRKCYGIKNFTPNHLRHTISTRMREIGIRPDIVERIIGHHVDSGVIGVYSSYNWLPEMREALVKWAGWILET